MVSGRITPDAEGISVRIAFAWNDRGMYAYGHPHEVEELVAALDSHVNMRTAILDVQLPPIEMKVYGVAVPPETTEDGVELKVQAPRGAT